MTATNPGPATKTSTGTQGPLQLAGISSTSWTVATLPSSATTGFTAYCYDVQQWYYYNGTAWISINNSPNVPKWVHVGVGLTYQTFSTASGSNTLTLFSLAAGGVIHGIKIITSTAFAGPSIVSYKLSVGIATSTALLASPFECITAVTSTNFQMSSNFYSFDNANATNITVTAASTNANLSTATAGVVDIYALVSVAL